MVDGGELDDELVSFCDFIVVDVGMIGNPGFGKIVENIANLKKVV
ncbi:hypothetical protein [Archaeoglobus sp.]|nr:hypothetical protein [Archaeoglobus sp.]